MLPNWRTLIEILGIYLILILEKDRLLYTLIQKILQFCNISDDAAIFTITLTRNLEISPKFEIIHPLGCINCISYSSVCIILFIYLLYRMRRWLDFPKKDKLTNKELLLLWSFISINLMFICLFSLYIIYLFDLQFYIFIQKYCSNYSLIFSFSEAKIINETLNITFFYFIPINIFPLGKFGGINFMVFFKIVFYFNLFLLVKFLVNIYQKLKKKP